MLGYAIAIILSLIFMGLLLSERKLYLIRGMSERFYNIFAAALACFIVCGFISCTAALCLLVPLSIAAPVLCLNNFKGEVWQTDKFSYILAGISVVTLGICSRQVYNYYHYYPNYNLSFTLLLVFSFSTIAFYLVTCRNQLKYMKKTEVELLASESKKDHGAKLYVIPIFLGTFIMTGIFDTDLRNACQEKIFEQGKIYFCAEITDVTVSTTYGRKGRSYLEYGVITDYIETETNTPYIFYERDDRGSVDGMYWYSENPEKFGKSPYVPKQKVIIERAYTDDRVFKLVNKQPSAKQVTDFKRPIVEKDSVRYYLDTYADIDFLRANKDFYLQYCGLSIVIKAAKVDEIDGKNVYKSPFINDSIYYTPKAENNLDTMLFFKTVSSKDISNWICMNNKYQTQENLAKISSSGYFFNDSIWTKEDFQSRISELGIPLE